MPQLATRIWLDGKGTARLDNTGMKVHLLAATFFAEGSDVNRFREAYPELTPEQIHAVMAYIDEHQESIKGRLAEDEQWAENLFKEIGESPAQKRMRRLKYGQ